ncbi:Lytic murein transglycosylase [Nitrobacter hamburgensis X14]|uniref:Lytic murein transglycosylase n=1 Tax=Nitrobacter hamburgensis (strain DSM 10229 / NCIMB 13809 / X14) TaxID=323097 RepID=Q1QPA7_NITHX|nr:lytic murein transglycosylase [Nitrobacter hamburgensis]ABE61940.1 Lytic murein transglycosylase [Nitrobacter hamburgensis X14]
MLLRFSPFAIVPVLLATLAFASPALAQRGASCHNGMSFPQFLRGLEQDAQKAGVSQRAISAAAPYMVYDQGIVNRDRGQRVFGQLFTQFAGRMASEARRVRGQKLIKQHAQAFARAEKQYGVPAAVITAFWALESDFGAVQGKLSTLRSLVSLAYDCRRAEMFHDETIAALKIVDRGDLTPSEMIGSWAGELGQTQFLPRHYYDYAVDYDGDGRRDLIHSAADVIGSTANYIATGLKWKRGEPWLQEVRVSPNAPSHFPWDQADLTSKHPRSQWAAWGVAFADGKPLPHDQLPASLLLPMGRNGPAFLAYDNFGAYTEWNNSLIYSTTAAYLATRIAGAAPMRKPSAQVAQLTFAQIKQLQQLLVKAGYDVGKVDGVLGQQTRSAVKAMQVKYGQPADSWPTAELLARMRGHAAPPAGPAEATAEPPRPVRPHR